ncbi:phosphatidylserine decarboxylase [Alkalihalophilus pseudofirmus]|uniref:phosphatidylserine decarboxylase n=1 Tax=Alkalihalophilus pseudofirmus TaxID=79885 RepID=UPI00259B5E7F|nr:phosphatidylserine decarboxylase [Alkalihalophilus pseudofirmus]WEG17318.1 phosphatidylserine decarboxylase [Alkalihalophilus pseudofirmus]
MVKQSLYRLFIELSNHKMNSLILKSFAESKMSRRVNRSFTKTFNLNEQEMLEPVHSYKSLHELFIRRLKPESRPINQLEDILVSPVDGILAEQHILAPGVTFHVKGQDYTLEEMLGSSEAAGKYDGGVVMVLYLSPSHYHRIHSPADAEITKQWTLGGRSYPVNNWGLLYGRRPLSRNYRVITELNVSGKQLAVVKVGAMNVNTIELTHKNSTLSRGEEMGYFSFGSTVVLVGEKGLMELADKQTPADVLMGQKLTNRVN